MAIVVKHARVSVGGGWTLTKVALISRVTMDA